MDRKLIVELVRVRDAGWIIPRYQHAFRAKARGVLTLNDNLVPWLHRQSRVATLIDPETCAPVAGINPLLDAVLLRATADEWVLAGFERVVVPIAKEIDCAQTWIVRAVALTEITETA